MVPIWLFEIVATDFEVLSYCPLLRSKYSLNISMMSVHIIVMNVVVVYLKRVCLYSSCRNLLQDLCAI